MNEKIVSKVFDKLFIEGKTMKTINAYEYQISKFLNWSEKHYLKVRQTDIEKYIKYLRQNGKAHATINQAIAALRFLFESLLKRKFRLKSLKKQEKFTKSVDHDIIMDSINIIKNSKHRLLIYLLYGSGLRVSEAVNIRHEDIVRNEIMIRQGKGQRDRKAILSMKFLECYEKFKTSNGFIFKGKNGHLTVRSAQEIVKGVFRTIGHVHPHMMRASFATHLLESKVDSHYIQKLMGHKSIKSTEGYWKGAKINLNNVMSPIDI